MERLSKNHPNVDELEWKAPTSQDYFPTLRYENGFGFPSRPSGTNSFRDILAYEKHYHINDTLLDITKIENYEKSIPENYVDTISFLFGGTFHQNNVNNSDANFCHIFASIGHKIFGFSANPVHKAKQFKYLPNVMHHYETSMRDPIFFQMYKRILHMHHYKSHVQYYRHNDLILSGVKITDTEISDLVTFMDIFDWDLANALHVKEEEFNLGGYNIRAKQWRLNHEPFNITMYVHSQMDIDVTIKVNILSSYKLTF